MKFTRYLYEESAVKSAFVSSLLNRSDDALFWIFELFHSGLDVSELLMTVYEDFYATNCPYLRDYVTRATIGADAQSLANIVATMLISKFNADIFLLRKIVRELEIDRDDVTGYLKLAYQLDDEERKSELINVLVQTNNGRRRALICEVDDIDEYETVKMTPVYRTLAAVGLKSLAHESLYKLKGREGIDDAYRNNWMYFALRTPYWAERLENVDVDDDEKEVTFKTDEEQEAFHAEYGYEPDEQPLEIQRMATCKIESVTDWVAFYKKYRGVVELDEDILREL